MLTMVKRRRGGRRAWEHININPIHSELRQRRSAPPRVLEEVGQEPADNYTSSRRQPFSPLLSTRVISTAASPYKCLVWRGVTTMLTKRLHSTLFIPMALRSLLIEWVSHHRLSLNNPPTKRAMICLSLLKRQSLSSFHLWLEGAIIIILW